jgi:hypothetical protein
MIHWVFHRPQLSLPETYVPIKRYVGAKVTRQYWLVISFTNQMATNNEEQKSDIPGQTHIIFIFFVQLTDIPHKLYKTLG